jgi:SP family arabinose:H+ symporter-like MFS transporter
LYFKKKGQNNNQMSRKLLLWSITVALGGFLFGFDTAVISGAEKAIQIFWNLSDFQHGLVVAIALYGTVIGALFGGVISDKLGRKRTLFWIGILYFISAAGSAIAPEVYSFMIFRFIGGIGVGASSVAAPLYISEIAPAEQRGRLVAMFQFNIVFGILIAYLSNYLLQGIGWRWMIGVEAFPALAFILMLFSVPRSPRWLMQQGEEAEAMSVLNLINPQNAMEQFSAIKASLETAVEKSQNNLKTFFAGKYSFPILLAFLLAFFNQLSGINAVIYYAPRIFEQTGMGASSSLLATTGVGIANLVFTMLGLALIDKLGRKQLLIIGSIGYIVSLFLITRAFMTEDFTGFPIFVFLFIAAHAIGQGAIIWVYIAEIFPNKVRGYGQSFGTSTHWIFAAVIANAFPYFVGKYSSEYIFGTFAIMMVLQLLFALFLMPETKGVSLEELEKKMVKK